jgi:hypothetical protein
LSVIGVLIQNGMEERIFFAPGSVDEAIAAEQYRISTDKNVPPLTSATVRVDLVSETPPTPEQ